MPNSKVAIRNLPLVNPPIPDSGGRIDSPAGELARIVNGESYSFLAYIEFLAGAPILRGRHYHAQKTENLYIISGRLRARFLDIDTGESSDAELVAGDLVTISPRCAHVYEPLEPSQAVEFSTSSYDPTDTVPYDLAVDSPRAAV